MICSDDVYTVNQFFHTHFIIYTEALYCSHIRCLGVNAPDSLTGVEVLQI